MIDTEFFEIFLAHLEKIYFETFFNYCVCFLVLVRSVSDLFCPDSDPAATGSARHLSIQSELIRECAHCTA